MNNSQMIWFQDQSKILRTVFFFLNEVFSKVWSTEELDKWEETYNPKTHTTEVTVLQKQYCYLATVFMKNENNGVLPNV